MAGNDGATRVADAAASRSGLVAIAPADASMMCGLAIFVKTPGLSPVKTRLAQTIGVDAAIEFHRYAAQATASVARAAVAQGVAVAPYWAVAERGAIRDPLWQNLPVLWQGNGSLGERLDHVYSTLQARHRRALLIGADTPQITVALLSAALAALDDPRTPCVIANATDGGFALFGARVPIPGDVWRSVRYSQAQTAAELVAALASVGHVARLAELGDVDTGDDVPALIEALTHLPDPLAEQSALHAWLCALGGAMPVS